MIINGNVGILSCISTGSVQREQHEPLRAATGTGSRWTRWLRSLNIPLPSDFFWSSHLVLRGHKETSDELKGNSSFQEEAWAPQGICWFCWSSFWPLSVFQMSQVQEMHLKQLLQEWRTTLTQLSFSAPSPFSFFFRMWMTMFKPKPHLTQINVNRCTKSCIEVKY